MPLGSNPATAPPEALNNELNATETGMTPKELKEFLNKLIRYGTKPPQGLLDELANLSTSDRIKSDEIWYYHDGDPLEIIIQNEAGVEYIVRLGKALETGCVMQYVVPAGCWFGARVADGGAFTLVGCQVTPGFDFRDFELMNPSDV